VRSDGRDVRPSPGVDRVNVEDYERNLEANLQRLLSIANHHVSLPPARPYRLYLSA
ncbi:MAG: hypothetical protein JO288_12230, partial [Hyphomicrobiales bacterium]|nr:hypothetical protein [Hyphomicrobiales bacterium]